MGHVSEAFTVVRTVDKKATAGQTAGCVDDRNAHSTADRHKMPLATFATNGQTDGQER